MAARETAVDRSALLASIRPGATIVRVRPLRGGLSAITHAIDLRTGDGARERVVLRRQRPEQRFGTPEVTAREFRTLVTVNSAGVPTPKPLYLDAEGHFFGQPAIMMSFAGRPLVAPPRRSVWLNDLAGALATIHAIRPTTHDLDHLPTSGSDDIQAAVRRDLPPARAHDALARRVSTALRRGIDQIEWQGLTLTHDDYHPGNTLWRRGRLTAVVDWTKAQVGDPRIDVAQCRSEIALLEGHEAADEFLAAYQSAASVPVRDIWFFDLLRGLLALTFFKQWLVGYEELRLTGHREDVAEARVREFLVQALAASRS